MPQNYKVIRPFRIYYWLNDYILLINFLIQQINRYDSSTILDFGCGDGRLLNELKIKNKYNLIGYEISSQASLFFNAFNPQIKLINSTENLKLLADKIDLIIFSEVIEHIPDDKINENINLIYKLLKKDGILIVTAPHENIPVHKKHYRHYNSKTLLNNFDLSMFELVEKRYLFRLSKIKTLIRKILFNRFFIINSELILKLFHLLNKSFLFGSEENCSNLFMVFKKK